MNLGAKELSLSIQPLPMVLHLGDINFFYLTLNITFFQLNAK